MEVIQVTVEIHVNNPIEYGHYDASVRLTANLGYADNPTEVIEQLRALARQQVREECDRWLETAADPNLASWRKEYHTALQLLGDLVRDWPNEATKSNAYQAALDFLRPDDPPF